MDMQEISICVKNISSDNKSILQINTWIKNNKPSIKVEWVNQMVKDIFSELEADLIIKQFQQFMNKLLTNKTPSIVYKVIFQKLQSVQNIQKMFDIKLLQNIWTKIHVSALQKFIQLFHLDLNHLGKQNVIKKIEKYIQNQDIHQLKTLLKAVRSQEVTDYALSLLTTNRHASSAADLIKQLKLDPKDYPQIGKRLAKNSVRFFVREVGWKRAEQLFIDNPQALGQIVQDLVFKEQLKGAIYLNNKYNLYQKNVLYKQGTLNFFKQKRQLQQDYDPYQKDIFAPSNNSFLSFHDISINRESVIFLSDHTSHQELEVFYKSLYKAKLVGIDTQTRPGTTKFSKKKNISTLQIGIDYQLVYIIDGLSKKAIQCCQQAYLLLLQNEQILKIGHTIIQDIQSSLKLFSKKVVILVQQKPKSVIQLLKIHDNLWQGKSKKKSLAYLCQLYCGKPLEKVETLSNWQLRPLRQSQLHYAGLDAICPLYIYREMVQRWGKIVVNDLGQSQNI